MPAALANQVCAAVTRHPRVVLGEAFATRGPCRAAIIGACRVLAWTPIPRTLTFRVLMPKALIHRAVRRARARYG